MLNPIHVFPVNLGVSPSQFFVLLREAIVREPSFRDARKGGKARWAKAKNNKARPSKS
jgi:hypothetical protein